MGLLDRTGETISHLCDWTSSRIFFMMSIVMGQDILLSKGFVLGCLIGIIFIVLELLELRAGMNPFCVYHPCRRARASGRQHLPN